jgi:hypothetical protein
VTCLRLSSRCIQAKSGSAYCRCPCFFPALRYIPASRTMSVTSSPSGQVRPEVAKRFSVSRTVDGTTPVSRAIWCGRCRRIPGVKSRAHGACKLSLLASICSSATAKKQTLNTASEGALNRITRARIRRNHGRGLFGIDGRLHLRNRGADQGSILAHWASVNTNRSIQSLNHNQTQVGILNLNRP